jgi:hypothetical protein
MSMTSVQGERRCEICGREFPSVEEAGEHLQTEHGGPSGREPGGTTGLGPKSGSGPTGTTTSGSRPPTDTAGEDDETGGTVEQTDGGDGRVQTE